MSLSLDLTAYVEENKADLISKAILGGKTMELVDVRYGIKSTEQIPTLESTAPFQAGANCGFTSSGTTTISKVQIATSPIKVAEEICLQDLEAYFTQKYLPAGARPETATIAQDIINRKVANIAKSVDQALWQGKTTYTNSTVLKAINGFISTIDTAGTAVAATQQSQINANTVLGIFEDIYTKIPAAAIYNEPVIAFCGMDTFRILLNKITATYGFYGNYTTDAAAGSWSLVYPGTNMRVTAIGGMNADNSVDTGVLATAVKNRIIATYGSNLVVGTDLGTDMTQMDAWYSKDNQTFRMLTRFRLGVAVKFNDHVVQYTNS
jgi:hypothetical protein